MIGNEGYTLAQHGILGAEDAHMMVQSTVWGRIAQFCQLLAIASLFCLSASAEPNASPSAFGNDGIDRTDPNFVKASLLIVSPSDEIYSCVGHSGIRLECPKFNLDYCFTYESESAKRVLSFIQGKLKMGMFAMPTEEYLRCYKADGRGVVQYRLNLPPEAKQRLWKILDEKVAEGANLPYDCLKRGCAQSIFVNLREALKPSKLNMVNWADKYKRTRREIIDQNAKAYPWDRFFLCAVIGIDADRKVSCEEKVIVPSDLLEVLQNSTVNGRKIIDSDGVKLVSMQSVGYSTIVTPLVVSCLVLMLSLFDMFAQIPLIGMLLFGLYSILGTFFTYIMFLSDFPGSGWNSLLVPFNLLPLVFWKWRKTWALWFVGVLLLWEIGMIAAPHRLTDPAYLVLVGAYIIFYLKFTRFGRVALLRDRIGRAVAPRLPHKGNDLK